MPNILSMVNEVSQFLPTLDFFLYFCLKMRIADFFFLLIPNFSYFCQVCFF